MFARRGLWLAGPAWIIVVPMIIKAQDAYPPIIDGRSSDTRGAGRIASSGPPLTQRVTVVADSAQVAERLARTSGHQARFTVTNHEPTTDTFHVGCVGLARVRCTGTSVTELTLGPGASDVDAASYSVADAGRGQVRVTVFSPGTRARGSGATIVPVRQ